jgi:hypothetical protein
MENLFPNAHGITLWAVCFAALISAACVGAFIHSLYELWRAHNPKKIVYELDEFEDRDDPFAVLVPRDKEIWTFRFESAVALAMWITGNIPNPFRQEQLMNLALTHKKLHGEYVLNTELLGEECEWINFK